MGMISIYGRHHGCGDTQIAPPTEQLLERENLLKLEIEEENIFLFSLVQ